MSKSDDFFACKKAQKTGVSTRLNSQESSEAVGNYDKGEDETDRRVHQSKYDQNLYPGSGNSLICQFLFLNEPIRRKIAQNVTFSLDKESAGLFQSFVWGQSSQLSPQLQTQLRSIGLSYLSTLSSLHVLLLFMLFQHASQMLPIYFRYQKLLFTFFFVVLFSVLFGLNGSTCRAVWLIVNDNCAHVLFHRPFHRFYSFALFQLILAVIQPIVIFQIGYQLSWLSYCGLFFAQSWPLKRRSSDQLKQQRRVGKFHYFFLLFQYFQRSFWISLWVEIFTLPLLSFYFGTISLGALIANSLITPFFIIFLASAVFYCGIVLLPVSFITSLSSLCIWTELHMILYALDFIQKWLVLQIQVSPSFTVLLMCYLLLFSFGLSMYQQKRSLPTLRFQPKESYKILE